MIGVTRISSLGVFVNILLFLYRDELSLLKSLDLAGVVVVVVDDARRAYRHHFLSILLFLGTDAACAWFIVHSFLMIYLFDLTLLHLLILLHTFLVGLIPEVSSLFAGDLHPSAR